MNYELWVMNYDYVMMEREDRFEKLGRLLNASLGGEAVENRTVGLTITMKNSRVERSRSQVQVRSIKYGYMHVNS